MDLHIPSIMKQFTLELLFHLMGVSATSGLVNTDQELHIIADDSSYLYHVDMDSQLQTKTPLTEYFYGREQMEKSIKPDFEAITEDESNFYVFGSGSEDNRIDYVEVSKLTNEVKRIEALDILYGAMQSFAGITKEDFNIEGVIQDNGTWYFFNRGNGPLEKNGVFVVTGESVIDDFRLTFHPIKLPKLKKVRTGFTDAVKVGNDIYFLAGAEATKSTYADGEILGTYLGKLDIEKMKVTQKQLISSTHKFEGISVLKENDEQLTFILCEDPDDPTVDAGIYKLVIQK